MIALKGYSAFFDASIDHIDEKTDASTVVAGFVSSVEMWDRWETDWRITLASYDVPYFHMKEFTARRKAFSHPKWKSEAYRSTFVRKLIQITREYTLASVGSSTKKSVFDYQNHFFDLSRRYNPYVLSARDAAHQARIFVREKMRSELPIAFIYERGDRGWGMLVKEMEASGLPSPIRKHARPDPSVDDPPAIQLQACDLLAWEIRRGKLDIAEHKKKRASFESLISFPNKLWFEAAPDDLLSVIKAGKIPLRKEWKHLGSVGEIEKYQNAEQLIARTR